MGNGISAEKCPGCEKTTPFYGEIYGRMSEDVHGARKSGMGCGIVDIDAEDTIRQYSQFNTFKNKLLIPLYGTVLAIRTIYAGLNRDIKKWKNLGLSPRLAINLCENNKLKYWFTARIVIALIPGVGTIINGTLDIIAQLGVKYKNSGTATIQGDVQEL